MRLGWPTTSGFFRYVRAPGQLGRLSVPQVRIAGRAQEGCDENGDPSSADRPTAVAACWPYEWSLTVRMRTNSVHTEHRPDQEAQSALREGGGYQSSFVFSWASRYKKRRVDDGENFVAARLACVVRPRMLGGHALERLDVEVGLVEVGRSAALRQDSSPRQPWRRANPEGDINASILALVW